MEFVHIKTKTNCFPMNITYFKEKFIRILIACTPNTSKQLEDFYYLMTNIDNINLICLSGYREEIITFHLSLDDKKSIKIEENQPFFRHMYALYSELYNRKI